jgi:F-type H+-transporting ATPase subunit delta
MAETLTVARPYAEAAFRHARDAGNLSAWSSALSRVAEVVAQDAARAVLDHPALSSEQRAKLVGDVAGSLDEAQSNFVLLLAQNERLALAGEVAHHFDRLRNEHEGLIEAHIATAFPIDDAQVQAIVQTLTERFGRRVKASVVVEPELIGGVSIRMGDEVIDASVRGKLSQLSSALKA